MTGEGEGRFTAEVMTAAMRQIAADLTVCTDDAELLRLTNNAVFALPGAGIVIRITRSTTFVDRVQKVARLAQWFAQAQAPTVRLLASVDQPVAANGFLATVWHYVTPTPPAPTYEELGHVLRRFHELGVPPFVLPAWDPVGDARRRLADAEALADNDRAFLEHWCDQLAPRVADLNQRTKPGLVHADAHAGNLVRGQDHKVVLCDFDATCLGPWQVDLASVAAGEVRFGRSGAHRALATAYGYDVTTDPDWPLLRQARELKLVTAAVPLLASAPGIAREFTVRLDTIATDNHEARWTPFARLGG
ncbi:phosphotransferase enzyme family protein [Phytohabitans aurantiacus]|uniref:Aminoglycoside phosphotransferase n=1 Tax=Phytohabitans aurantiacus TaxID=3016789 RepID=A0ABQ5RBD7_9ACTN|nr:aminoglycoside phosphotransferase family protein [Phytohabitans aurantiacus]GLI03893.1 aminoglycoside phosphotransferase [Phytohabitans aurantiacus]